MVYFYPHVIVWEFNDGGYDRSSHDRAILTVEDLDWLSLLKSVMLKGRLIENNTEIPPAPIPRRVKHFNDFIISWQFAANGRKKMKRSYTI